MHAVLRTFACGLTLTGGLMSAATPALAAPCDAYSHTCPSTPPGIITGGTGGNGAVPTTTTGGGQVANPGTPTSLPFTGAQLVLFVLIGGGAIAGGSALVVAGRRKAHAGQ